MYQIGAWHARATGDQAGWEMGDLIFGSDGVLSHGEEFNQGTAYVEEHADECGGYGCVRI